MTKRLTYRDIENLPKDHPLVKEFIKQIDAETPDVEYVAPIKDEQSLAYFDRYIAGDR